MQGLRQYNFALMGCLVMDSYALPKRGDFPKKAVLLNYGAVSNIT